MGRRLLAVLAALAGAAILVTVGGWLMLAAFERQLIYFPTRVPTDRAVPHVAGAAEVEEVWVRTSDGVRIHGIHARRSDPIAELIYFHGNAGNLYDRIDHVGALLRSGFNVYIIDYRGYGKSEGRPTEEGLYRDAAAAYAHLTEAHGVPRERVIAHGHSLGSTVAIDLATRVAPGAVIAQSPFTSARAMARLHYAWIPEPLLGFMTHDFNSLQKAPSLRSPILYVHGTEDRIVPFAMGRELYEASPEPREWYEVLGAAHNDLWAVGGGRYYGRLADFARRYTARPTD